MSAITTPLAGKTGSLTLPYRGKVGMACLIIAEAPSLPELECHSEALAHRFDRLPARRLRSDIGE
jgi:hypothetical protein